MNSCFAKTKGKTMPLKTLLVSTAAMLSILVTTAFAGDPNLNAGQIASLFPGQYEAKVQGYKVKFAGDTTGQLVGQAFGREDRGTWFVQGNTLCVAWRQWTKGQPKCGVIAQQGSWLVANNDSGEMLRFRRSE